MENTPTANSMKALRFRRRRKYASSEIRWVREWQIARTLDGWYWHTDSVSTKPMTRNVYRDKEQESNVQVIVEAMQLMEVPVSVGWLAPKKLEAADRLGIEKEIAKYAADTGRAKVTEEQAKD